jgi:hypothetical protein
VCSYHSLDGLSGSRAKCVMMESRKASVDWTNRSKSNEGSIDLQSNFRFEKERGNV